MPVTGKIELYGFKELDDAVVTDSVGTARDRAREWYKENMIPPDWSQTIIEDIKLCASGLGIEIDQIFYHGLLDPSGDAPFDGRYTYREDAQEAIRRVSPDKTLHAIADSLESIQSLWTLSNTKPQPPLSARVEFDAPRMMQGHDEVKINVDLNADKRVSIDYPFSGQGYTESEIAAARAVTATMRILMEWIYRTLREGYRYMISDEHINEDTINKGYMFTERGQPLDPGQFQ